MNTVQAIEFIMKEYHEIEWLASNKSFSLGTRDRGYYIQTRKQLVKYIQKSQSKSLFINKFSKASEDDCEKLKDFIVITEIIPGSNLEKYSSESINIEITKGMKSDSPMKNLEFFRNQIEENKDYFQIKQDFFKSHIFKVLDQEEEYVGFKTNFEKFIQYDSIEKLNRDIRIENQTKWNDFGYHNLCYFRIWGLKFDVRINPISVEVIRKIKNNEVNESEDFFPWVNCDITNFLKSM